MDRGVKIVVVVLVSAASGFFIFTKIAGWHKNKLDTAIRQQQKISQRKANRLEQKVTQLAQELDAVKGPKVPEERLAQVFGEKDKAAEETAEREKPDRVLRDENQLPDLLAEKENDTVVKKIIPAAKGQTEMADIERQIMALFSYLDAQPYIQTYEFSKE